MSLIFLDERNTTAVGLEADVDARVAEANWRGAWPHPRYASWPVPHDMLLDLPVAAAASGLAKVPVATEGYFVLAAPRLLDSIDGHGDVPVLDLQEWCWVGDMAGSDDDWPTPVKVQPRSNMEVPCDE